MSMAGFGAGDTQGLAGRAEGGYLFQTGRSAQPIGPLLAR